MHFGKRVAGQHAIGAVEGNESHFCGARPLQKCSQAFHVLTPVEVGIGQKILGVGAGELVGVGKIVGMLQGAGCDMPEQQPDDNPAGHAVTQQRGGGDATGHCEANIDGENVTGADVDSAGEAAEQNDEREEHGLGNAAAKAQRQDEQHRERRFQRQRGGVVIPEAGAAAGAEQVGGVSGGVVGPQRLEAGEESRRGQAQVEIIDAREGEAVAGPDDHQRNRDGGGQPV